MYTRKHGSTKFKSNHKSKQRKFKYSQTKKQKYSKRSKKQRGGASDSGCDAAYVMETGMKVPANGNIPGLNIPSRKAMLR